ncbi:MAG: VIT domain-containing protein [Phycisphaerales bacterium]
MRAPSSTARRSERASTVNVDPSVLAHALKTTVAPAGEELWIIARPDTGGDPRTRINLYDQLDNYDSQTVAHLLLGDDAQYFHDDIHLDTIVGPCGGLVGVYPGRVPRILPMPLAGVDMQAQVSGFISSVELAQQFHNPWSEKIEAVYVFPLPHDATVNEFIMTIGERRIRGIIREREEAEALYYEARAAGYTASMMTQERPNIFTQRIANIEPGHTIDVSIRYLNTLRYDNGWYELAFPMVVGPRFSPSGTASPNIEYQGAERYQQPRVNMRVALDAGVPIEEIHSNTHKIETNWRGEHQANVSLAGNTANIDRDFVLRWRVAGDSLRAGVVTRPDKSGTGGHFALMIYPPAALAALERRPVEMVFVIDTSGSMGGEPLALVRDAVGRALDVMQPQDTFYIMRFSESVSSLGPEPLSATPRNLEQGRDFVKSLHADGGTYMLEGVKAALELPLEPGRDRCVVLLTDGFIDNDVEVLSVIAQDAEARRRDEQPDLRIFSFGIGSAPNRFLLERMAAITQGAAAWITGRADRPADAMETFMLAIAHPALEDVSIEADGIEVDDVYPARVPDLFVGRAAVVVGRYAGRSEGATINVRGYAGGREHAFALPVEGGSHDGVDDIWARTRIADLSSSLMQAGGSPSVRRNLEREISTLALEHGLVSDHTAFIAIDAGRTTSGRVGTTVNVPVAPPAGSQYETD